jgi:bacterial/archaeal transporter family-2 protein
MVWPYLLFAAVAGAMIPFQFGINAQLARWVGSPIASALVSFLGGTVALAIVMLIQRKPFPTLSKLDGAPWWVWIGGLLGAFYVAGSIFAAPKLGAVTLIAAIVAGQSVASLLIDQFGWVGFAEHHISPGRVAGMALVASGVALVRIF